MGQLIKNGVNYTGATGIIDNAGSTSSALALSANQGNKLANDMGSVELFDISSNAYAVGNYFIWKSQFVKVTQAIAVGDTIRIGTNVEATSIGNVLKELNSKFAALFKTRTIDATYTVDANYRKNVELDIPTIDGYTKIGFVEATSGLDYVALSRVYYRSVSVVNTINQSVSGDIVVTVLYVRNDLL